MPAQGCAHVMAKSHFIASETTIPTGHRSILPSSDNLGDIFHLEFVSSTMTASIKTFATGMLSTVTYSYHTPGFDYKDRRALHCHLHPISFLPEFSLELSLVYEYDAEALLGISCVAGQDELIRKVDRSSWFVPVQLEVKPSSPPSLRAYLHFYALLRLRISDPIGSYFN
jgi:hypothetical protein